MTRYTADRLQGASVAVYLAAEEGPASELSLMLQQAARDAALVDALVALRPRIAWSLENHATTKSECECSSCVVLRELDALLGGAR